MKKKQIMAINGSASPNSSNLAILNKIAVLSHQTLDIKVIDDLAELPHFKTELTDINVPEKIVQFRNAIASADGILICTPEYVFSIPSGLKNAIEWCVSTTVLSNKPTGLITASASGEKGHEELQLIMKTVMARFTPETLLLIQGVKSKVNNDGDIIDENTKKAIENFVKYFIELIQKSAVLLP